MGKTTQPVNMTTRVILAWGSFSPKNEWQPGIMEFEKFVCVIGRVYQKNAFGQIVANVGVGGVWPLRNVNFCCLKSGNYILIKFNDVQYHLIAYMQNNSSVFSHASPALQSTTHFGSDYRMYRNV